MKKNFLTIILSVLSIVACQSSKQQDWAKNNAIATLLDSGTFSFNAKSVTPTDYDAVRVINSFPGASGARILNNMDPGYTIDISDTLIVADLPYFGRAYNAPSDPSKAGFHFTSKDFNIKKGIDKNGNREYTITFKDERTVQQIYLHVFPNGNATASVVSRDRQPITYGGNITPKTK